MKPYVYLAVATTIDGRIASRTGYSRLSCPADLKRLHALRAKVDAVAVGANTAIVDNPRLTVRYVEGRNPTRVLIDGRLRAPPTLRLFDKSAPTVVFTTDKAPAEKVAQLKEMGVDVYIYSGEAVDPRWVLEKLAERGVKSVLLEGGGRVNWQFLHMCLVDEIVLTITPHVFGSGVSAVEGPGYANTDEMPYELHLASMKMCECGREVVINYKVKCKK